MARLEDLEDNLQGLEKAIKELPRRVGRVYLAHTQSSFLKGGFTNQAFQRWEPRKGGNNGRAVLVKSGALSRSLRMRITQTRITIGTNIPYAEIHNEGGVVSGVVKVRQHTRRIKQVGKRRRTRVNVRAHTRKMNTAIPRRQFMGPSKIADNQVVDLIEKQLSKYL